MRFSIVIPTYNRPWRLHGCLASLAALDYSRDRFEVIVVDDGSTQPVAAVAGGLNLKIIRQSNRGPASARNLGVAHASGEILAFLDDDCAPQPDWLLRMDAAAVRSPGALLGGRTSNGCDDNVYAAVNQLLVDTVIDWLRENSSPLQFFPSNNLAAPSADFREVGGFDSGFAIAAGEDRDLCGRWMASGRPLVEVPQACIVHYHPQSLCSFIGMHFRYGRGAALMHRSRNTTPLRYAEKGLYLRLLSAASGIPHRRLRTTALLGLTQAAAAAGYVFERH